MRVVVSVKASPGGSQTSQATRYIAYRDRDEEREGKDPRQLFSAKEDGLSFWKAERVLTEGRAPAKDELIHVAVSFREEDFQALSHDETTRQQSLKAVTREAVSQIADELKAERLTWVAGVHRNTDHPHVHLLINRTYSDRETGRERRLTRIPEEMLASRVSDENGVEKINPGSFGLAFENALDRAQERARVENRELEEAARNAAAARVDALSKTEKERAPTADERLLEAARRNPSIAGRELIQEIILRGPAPEPDERPEAPDVRIALRVPGLDDPDYRTQPEQADWIGKHSQELRDLYERGAEIKGDVLIIPAEEHELPEDRDQPFITSLSYAHQQIQNLDQAGEFHTLARTIAGETADPRTEIEVFRYYYDRIRRDEAGRDPSGDRAKRAEALNRTLDEMRLLAREMSGLETRESIEIARPVISFEETREAEREGGIDAGERGIFHDEDHESVADFHHPEIARLDEEAVVGEGREAEFMAGSFNTAARKVSLRDESLRLPSGLSFEMKERLVAHTLPAIDRLLESGRARAAIFASIDEKTYDRELSEKEREERFKVGVFLKAYVDERFKDPEARALNSSPAFRSAHKQITEVRTPAELNRVAEDFLRENLRQSAALRLHHTDPAARPKPETAPLNARERNLLFFGRAPEHHTPEMRELRHYWGLSRAERAARVEALRQEQLSPSPTLDQMLAELETRRTMQAIRHYQAAILNEQMRNPGKLDLRPMFERLPPHERTFLIERIEAKKQPLTRPQSPAPDPADHFSSRAITPPTARPFASIPRESNSYREYMASMGSIELRLLNEAVRQRQKDSGHIVLSKEEHPLSITEARALLPREEQVRIREQARNLAWEQIAPPEVFASEPEPAARRLSDTVAHLQEETQQRARLAHQALDEFVREKAGFNGRNDPHSADALSKLEPADAQRLRALEDYAARTREELYRGFESLDALRRELEKPRGHDDAGRNQQAESMSHSAPDRDRILSSNGHAAGKDLQLFNGSYFDSERNSTVGGDTERLPETLEPRSWFVDSGQKWHFDSLPSARDATSDRDFIVDSGRDDIAHDFVYDR